MEFDTKAAHVKDAMRRIDNHCSIRELGLTWTILGLDVVRREEPAEPISTAESASRKIGTSSMLSILPYMYPYGALVHHATCPAPWAECFRCEKSMFEI